MSLLRLSCIKTVTSISFALSCSLSPSWNSAFGEGPLSCCEPCVEAHMAGDRYHRPTTSEDVKAANPHLSELGADPTPVQP